MEINSLNSISFGKKLAKLEKKRHFKVQRNYTEEEVAVMKDMKHAALTNCWHDIYTGKKFGKNIHPSVEHLIPYVDKDTETVQAKAAKGFKINGLDNIFPVDRTQNMGRSNEPFIKTVLKNPKILDRLAVEMQNYKSYKSDLIDGNEWFSRLKETIADCLTGLCSKIKTKKLYVHKISANSISNLRR